MPAGAHDKRALVEGIRQHTKSDVAVRIAFWPLDNCGTPDQINDRISSHVQAEREMVCLPSSHPLMTLPTPISVTNGWPLMQRYDQERLKIIVAILTDLYSNQTLCHHAKCPHSEFSLCLNT
jgi:hypothetical protein